MADTDEIIEAAIEWVEAIHDHPSAWGDTTDFALVTAVLSAYPDVHPKGEVCGCGRGCGLRADWLRFRVVSALVSALGGQNGDGSAGVDG